MNNNILKLANKPIYGGEREFVSKVDGRRLFAFGEVDYCECGKTILRVTKSLWMKEIILNGTKSLSYSLKREEVVAWFKENLCEN